MCDSAFTAQIKRSALLSEGKASAAGTDGVGLKHTDSVGTSSCFSVKPKRKPTCGETSGGEDAHFTTGSSGLCDQDGLNLEICGYLVRRLVGDI